MLPMAVSVAPNVTIANPEIISAGKHRLTTVNNMNKIK